MIIGCICVIIDRLPVELEIRRMVIVITKLLCTSFQYSKVANNTTELEDCEQANKLGAINSTLRQVLKILSYLICLYQKSSVFLVILVKQ